MKRFFFALTASLMLWAPQAGAHAADTDLNAILADRPDAQKARDQYRHPKETIEFFGIKEGMTIIDVLPGAWYGSILAPLIGNEGTYIGSVYSENHYKKMSGDSYTPPATDRATAFASRLESWSAASPAADFFQTFEAPERLYGTVDVYLFLRALHHLNKLDSKDLDAAAVEAFKLVKHGGVVGVVQHRAPETASKDWAKGFNGYIKESRVIDAFTKAGFVLEAKSEINANPKDQPQEGDYVWRLPPALNAPEEKKADYLAIGESDRMTLKFRKP